MTRGISVRCAAKQPRNTAANFVSFGIIVIHCPKQARAAFANLVAMAVIVLDRTKKTGAAGDFLLCHSESTSRIRTDQEPGTIGVGPRLLFAAFRLKTPWFNQG